MNKSLTKLRVSDIMRRDFAALREEDNLERVGDSMIAMGLRSLPVVDGDVLVGLLKLEDTILVGGLSPILAKARGDRAKRMFVAERMTRVTFVAFEDESIGDVATRLEDYDGLVPVLDRDDRLVGILGPREWRKAFATAVPTPRLSLVA